MLQSAVGGPVFLEDMTVSICPYRPNRFLALFGETVKEGRKVNMSTDVNRYHDTLAHHENCLTMILGNI